MSLYQLVFGKSCHLPVEIEPKDSWDFRAINVNSKSASQDKVDQLLIWRNFASALMKVQFYIRKGWLSGMMLKFLHQEFRVGDMVLLFNSHLRLFPVSLSPSGWVLSKWSMLLGMVLLKLEKRMGRYSKSLDKGWKYFGCWSVSGFDWCDALGRWLQEWSHHATMLNKAVLGDNPSF